MLTAYLFGGCVAGSLTQTGKKPASPQATYGMYAYLAILLIVAIFMAFRSIKLKAEQGELGWWAVYANPVTAAVCFVAGFLLITVGLF